MQALGDLQCIIIVSKMTEIRCMNIKLRCIKYSQNYDKNEDMAGDVTTTTNFQFF